MRKCAAVVFVLLMAGSSTAINLDVEVDSITEMDAYFLKYQNSTSGIQNLNLTAENAGSIGCQYRIRSKFKYGNTTEIRFSEPHALQPSETAVASLKFFPQNYTGKVEAEVYSHFCDQEQRVENFSYIQSERVVLEDSVDSKTLRADKDAVKVDFPVENGTVVPVKTPAYWKSPSADVENGEALIRYDPPIFSSRENLTYAVVNSQGKALGTTKIKLRVEETYVDRLKQRLPRILGILLLLSLIINSKFLFDRHRLD